MKMLYRPGGRVLHRMPAGAKLLGLVVVAATLSLFPLGVWGTLGALCAASGLHLLSGAGWRGLGEEWWRLRWLILVLSVALWIFLGWQTAVVNTGRVVALVLLAGVVTATTLMSDLIDLLRRLLRPLRPLGVDADTVALAISLTIAMIPVVWGIVDRVREAQRARGIGLGIRSSVPVLILTMRKADAVAEALAARGLV